MAMAAIRSELDQMCAILTQYVRVVLVRTPFDSNLGQAQQQQQQQQHGSSSYSWLQATHYMPSVVNTKSTHSRRYEVA